MNHAATAPDQSSTAQLRLPILLRRASGHLPDGPHRDALLNLACELEVGGDPAPVSHATLWAALKAFGSPDHLPNAPFHFCAGDITRPEEPEHLQRVAFLRREADYYPDGPARDALLRYADELEDKGEDSLVAPKTVHAALKAFGSPDRLPDIDVYVCTCWTCHPHTA